MWGEQTKKQHLSILDATVNIGQRPHCTRTLITSRLECVNAMLPTYVIRESLIKNHQSSYGAEASGDTSTYKKLLPINEDPAVHSDQIEDPVQREERTVLQEVHRHSIYLS